MGIGKNFGFANFGALFGIVNVIASIFQAMQTPMVSWSEDRGSYETMNFVLWAVTIPLFLIVYFVDPMKPPPHWIRVMFCYCDEPTNKMKQDESNDNIDNETTRLLLPSAKN